MQTVRFPLHLQNKSMKMYLFVLPVFVLFSFVFVLYLRAKRLKSSYPGKRCPRVVAGGPNLFSNDKLMQKLLRQSHTCDSFTRIGNRNKKSEIRSQSHNSSMILVTVLQESETEITWPNVISTKYHDQEPPLHLLYLCSLPRN